MNYKIYEALLKNDKRCFHMIPTSHFNLMFPLGSEFLWSRHFSRQVMIPEVACRHLIGARGDRIKLLREESRCEAQLHQGSGLGVC